MSIESGNGGAPLDRVGMVVLHSHPLAEPGLGDAGGMTVYVREVAGALARRGVAVDLYTRVDCLCRPEESELAPGVRVITLPAGGPEASKEELPEHLPEFTSNLLARIESSGDRYDLLHSHYWLSGTPAAVVARRLGVPLVHTFHTLGRAKNSWRRVRDLPEPERRLAGETRVISEADAIVASTPQERRWLIDLYAAHPEKVRLIPPGVDHLRFRPGDRASAKERLGLKDERVLLFVGRLQPLKAADTAVRALAKLLPRASDLKLLVVGGASGPAGASEEKGLRRLAENLGVARAVRFLPAQPHHMLPDFYRAADVCLVPSYYETFGLVALEAQACGVPVVASAVGGLRSTVVDGVTGFLVDPTSPAQFADRAWSILSSERRASTMSRAAVDNAARFSWDRSAAELLVLYGDCVLAPEEVAAFES